MEGRGPQLLLLFCVVLLFLILVVVLLLNDEKRFAVRCLLDEKLNQFDLYSAVWSTNDRERSNSLNITDRESD